MADEAPKTPAAPQAKPPVQPQAAAKHLRPKIKPPHARDAKRDPNGKPTWPEAKAIITAMIPQFDDGHYSFDDIGQVSHVDRTQQDEHAIANALKSLQPNQALIWFVRGEVNPNDKGQEIPGVPKAAA